MGDRGIGAWIGGSGKLALLFVPWTTRRRRASRPVRGTRPTRENTRSNALELPGRVQGVASTLPHGTHVEDGRQSLWSCFGNWLFLAVVCEVKSAVGALG